MTDAEAAEVLAALEVAIGVIERSQEAGMPPGLTMLSQEMYDTVLAGLRRSVKVGRGRLKPPYEGSLRQKVIEWALADDYLWQVLDLEEAQTDTSAAEARVLATIRDLRKAVGLPERSWRE